MPQALIAHVQQAAVDRYRSVLALQATDLTTRKQADPSADLPAPLTPMQIDGMAERFAAHLATTTAVAKTRLAKAVGPEGVGPRDRDARVYNQRLRRTLLAPLMRQVRTGLSTAVGAAEAIDSLAGATAISDRRAGLISDEVDAQAARLSGHHREDLIKTFRGALGVNIADVLTDDAIAPLMADWRRENIGLIKTIPTRLHAGLEQRMSEAFAEQPFNRKTLQAVIREEGEVSGWNLQRLTRDQSNKASGQLTRARHQQLGITEYIWRAISDQRVRPSHAALNGTRQSWDEPVPGEDFPGSAILCRCTAQPVVEGLEYPEAAE